LMIYPHRLELHSLVHISNLFSPQYSFLEAEKYGKWYTRWYLTFTGEPPLDLELTYSVQEWAVFSTPCQFFRKVTRSFSVFVLGSLLLSKIRWCFQIRISRFEVTCVGWRRDHAKS
jgi:hypothetical protein